MEAGASVPAINGYDFDYPPLANQWAATMDSKWWVPGFQTDISSWALLSTDSGLLQPGWMIAYPRVDDAGHVAITDYDGEGIGAGQSGTVNKRFKKFWDGTSRVRAYEP